ncbi:hypothetical protein PO909_025694, partial [Leuciscus waleckii]
CLSFWKGIGLQPILGCERADLWPESFSLHYGTLMKDEEGIRHNYSCSDLALSTHLISELGGMRNFNQIPDILLRVLLQLGHDSEPAISVCVVTSTSIKTTTLRISLLVLAFTPSQAQSKLPLNLDMESVLAHPAERKVNSPLIVFMKRSGEELSCVWECKEGIATLPNFLD